MFVTRIGIPEDVKVENKKLKELLRREVDMVLQKGELQIDLEELEQRIIKIRIDFDLHYRLTTLSKLTGLPVSSLTTRLLSKTPELTIEGYGECLT